MCLSYAKSLSKGPYFSLWFLSWKEKQNYKTSKIAWGTSMTSWTFLINCRNCSNWIIYIWDTNQSFHTEKGVIIFLNCYSWKTLCILIEIKRNYWIWCSTPLSTNFSYIVGVSFIGFSLILMCEFLFISIKMHKVFHE
jgi:hypothetical protein